MLGKLYIPETIDDDKIRTLKLLLHNIRAVGISLINYMESLLNLAS